jgi:hypothetical protein
MPNKLETIVLAAPGFWGKNTQDSPLDLDVRFAADADNCVIDRKGRIAARKGTTLVSTNGASVLGSSAGIEFVQEFLQEDGSKVLFSAGNNKVFTGTTTLSDVTPGAATVTANKWQGATLSDKFYFFQESHEPLVYTAGGSLGRVQDEGAYSGTVPQGNVVLSAFGRLFVAGASGDKSVVYWSDLLNGLAWTSGSSGSIDLRKFWPRGYDEITALSEHNGNLIVFGKTSIIIFGGAESPSTMQIVDVIDNIGCIARDTVAKTGTDIIFLSSTGLRTLGRTIQEKSSPIADASKNVNDEVKQVAAGETTNTVGHFNLEEGFYVLSFRESAISYVFDTRYPLQDGSLRCTTWSGLVPLYMTRTDAGDFYIGTATGVEKYSGYLDAESNTYDLSWLTHPLSFGVPGNLKFLKNIDVTLEGGSGFGLVVRWAWDYKTSYTTETIDIPVNNVAEYGEGEYAVSEFSGSIALDSEKITAGGSGNILTVGAVTTVNNDNFSLQQIEIQATIGRVL